MFNLRRYFLLASAAAIIAVTVTLVVVYQRHSMDQLIQSAESKNVTLARAFANTIWPRFSSYVMSIPRAGRGPHGGPDGDALRARPETRSALAVKLSQSHCLISSALSDTRSRWQVTIPTIFLN